LPNKNKSLGIKYNGIDSEKKQRLSSTIYEARIYTLSKRLKKDLWNYHQDSTGTYIFKSNRYNSVEEAKTTGMDKAKELYNSITDNYIGSKDIYAYNFMGRITIGVKVKVNAIYEKDMQQFISEITGGLVKSQKDLDKIEAYDKRRGDIRDKRSKQARSRRD